MDKPCKYPIANDGAYVHPLMSSLVYLAHSKRGREAREADGACATLPHIEEDGRMVADARAGSGDGEAFALPAFFTPALTKANFCHVVHRVVGPQDLLVWLHNNKRAPLATAQRLLDYTVRFSPDAVAADLDTLYRCVEAFIAHWHPELAASGSREKIKRAVVETLDDPKRKHFSARLTKYI